MNQQRGKGQRKKNQRGGASVSAQDVSSSWSLRGVKLRLGICGLTGEWTPRWHAAKSQIILQIILPPNCRYRTARTTEILWRLGRSPFGSAAGQELGDYARAGGRWRLRDYLDASGTAEAQRMKAWLGTVMFLPLSWRMQRPGVSQSTGAWTRG